MTTWEVRTNGHRFIVCDSGSAPWRAYDYKPNGRSWSTLEAAEAAMARTARKLGHACAPGSPPKIESCGIPSPTRSRRVRWLRPPTL